MSDSFVVRKINLVFTLGKNLASDGTTILDTNKAAKPTFAGTGGSNQVTISGRRVILTITNAGQKALCNAQVRVFGLTQDQMNQLSTWGKTQLAISKTSVSILSGDDDAGMSTIFVGEITDAFSDYQSMPDVAFQFSAFSGGIAALTPAKPSSYQNGPTVDSVMRDLAGRALMNYQNSGVTTRLPPSYFTGTYVDQIADCAKHANIEFTIDQNTLSIWPKGQPRTGTVVLVSPETGMKGYPTFYPLGIFVEMLHRNDVGLGSMIMVQSSLPPACGKWIVSAMMHDLASETPGGPWFTRLTCGKPGTFPVAGYNQQ